MDIDRINKAKGDLIAVYSQMNTLLAPGKEEFQTVGPTGMADLAVYLPRL